MCHVIFVHKCSGMQSPEEGFSPLELELQEAVGWELKWVLRKSSECS